MKNTKYSTIFAISALVIYVIIINLISISNVQGYTNGAKDSTYSSGADIQLNVGDTVDVSIVRNRWYGKIYEEGNSKTLYIFNLLRLPLETNNHNYKLIHILFILLWIGTILIMETFITYKNNNTISKW